MPTTVTGKNQVTIPAALAAELGIRRGTRLEWRRGEQPHQLVVQILPDQATLAGGLKGAGRRHLPPGTSAVAALITEREGEAD